MSKCEVCGTYVGGGTLCAGCETLQARKVQEAENRAAKDVHQVRCDCGRQVMQVIARDKDGHAVKRPGPVPYCARCYMEARKENPSHKTDDGRDLYAGLATTDPNVRYVCPGCGGTVLPRNCWSGKTDYRCRDCGATAEKPPVEKEPYPELTPDELIAKLSDPKRMMFGPPRAISALRRAEGRNIYTGEPLGAEREYMLDDDDPPPF